MDCFSGIKFPTISEVNYSSPQVIISLQLMVYLSISPNNPLKKF